MSNTLESIQEKLFSIEVAIREVRKDMNSKLVTELVNVLEQNRKLKEALNSVILKDSFEDISEDSDDDPYEDDRAERMEQYEREQWSIDQQENESCE